VYFRFPNPLSPGGFASVLRLDLRTMLLRVAWLKGFVYSFVHLSLGHLFSLLALKHRDIHPAVKAFFSLSVIRVTDTDIAVDIHEIIA